MAESMSTGSGHFQDKATGYPRSPAIDRASQAHGGERGEISALRADLRLVFKHGAFLGNVEYTDVAASDADAFLTAQASETSAVEYVAADGDFDGVIDDGVLSVPRNILITTAGGTPADAPATATVVGEDIDGNALTETINVAQTATTAAGTKCFKKVSSISMPAGQGTDATVTFGTGALLGLPFAPKVRAGATLLMHENAAGSVPTAGALTSAATNAPHGAYQPHSSVAPNGARDYHIVYEGLYPAGLSVPPEGISLRREIGNYVSLQGYLWRLFLFYAASGPCQVFPVVAYARGEELHRSFVEEPAISIFHASVPQCGQDSVALLFCVGVGVLKYVLRQKIYTTAENFLKHSPRSTPWGIHQIFFA